ncbi:MAG: hypothetical protein E7266_05865 [Lachnospiraceae bacterium]|nr:hypothetical protein [Lachnospiraceae bacterium]
MRIFEEKSHIDNVTLDALQQVFPYDISKCIFFDIETTGFIYSKTILYLIGCMYIDNNVVHIIQFFSESKDDELDVLNSFFEKISSFSHLVSFNGNGFDIPYILKKCKLYNISYNFDNINSVDIYKDIQPLKNLFKTQNLKLKTMERFLGINRSDMFSGGELIEVYSDYLKNPCKESLSLLLLHNYEDIKGMLDLLHLYKYISLYNGNFEIDDITINRYEDMDGNDVDEILFDLYLPYCLPARISGSYDDIYITAYDNCAKIKNRLHNGCIKFYYEDYKNYYYLPLEDKAVHKSVAEFVDKSHRTKATKDNCYTWINADQSFTSNNQTVKKYLINLIKNICK